jgi:hypothetical protein
MGNSQVSKYGKIEKQGNTSPSQAMLKKFNEWK